MGNINSKFLQLLSIAISKENNVFKKVDLDQEELMQLYEISKTHNVIPLIYKLISKNNKLDNKLDIEFWKHEAIIKEVNQLQRTKNFLSIYNKFIENGLKPIVVKGIICRELYPIPNSRLSCDEDILIKVEDFNKYDEVLKNNNMISNNKDIIEDSCVTYYNGKSKLAIEVQRVLFDDNEENKLSELNELYNNCFEQCIGIEIQGTMVYTFPHTMNLLYLIAHTAKHFLHGGVGIRQVCDILKYIEAYNKEIDWDEFWIKLKKVNYDYFTFALIDIGCKYLGFNDTVVNYPSFYIKEEVCGNSLLEDILDAGVFGNSTIERKQSSLITLNAVNKGNEKSSKASFLPALFPKASDLNKRYTYLQNKPYLLPIAWVDRILKYSKEKNIKDGVTNSALETISIGNRRIELLQQYRIIE